MLLKASLDDLEWRFFSSLNYGEQHSRSVLLLILLGKLIFEKLNWTLVWVSYVS